MSCFTRCNYCNLVVIKYNAKQNDQEVLVVPAVSELDPPGFDVYVHPRGLEPDEVILAEPNEEGLNPYFVSWMWEIGDHCEC